MKVVLLAQAWETGALAGWVWNQLPKDLNKALTELMHNINVIRIAVIYLRQQNYKNVYCQILLIY